MEVVLRNRSRLDLLCVPLSVDCEIAETVLMEAQEDWERQGVWTAEGISEELVEGGASGVRLDRPGARVVYGNQLGGFRVWCPDCGEGMAGAFAHAMERVRSGGVLEATCPVCDRTHEFTNLRIRPPIRVGRSALIFEDAGGARLTERGRSVVNELIGPFAVILRRVS